MTAARRTTIDPDQRLALSGTLKETLIDLTCVDDGVAVPVVDVDFVLDIVVGPAYLRCQRVGSQDCHTLR
jgi:hypothetical protein